MRNMNIIASLSDYTNSEHPENTPSDCESDQNDYQVDCKSDLSDTETK